MKTQKGNTLVIGLIVTVVILTVIGLVANKFSRMQKELEEKSETIATLNTQLEQEKELTKKLSNDIRDLNAQIDLFKTNEKDAQVLREKNADTIAKLEAKVVQLTRTLPPVLGDQAVGPETVAEKENSAKRIMAVWDLYRYGIDLVENFDPFKPTTETESPVPHPKE